MGLFIAHDQVTCSGRAPKELSKRIGSSFAALVSLTENMQRKAMHPADQIDAFTALIAKAAVSRTLQRISASRR